MAKLAISRTIQQKMSAKLDNVQIKLVKLQTSVDVNTIGSLYGEYVLKIINFRESYDKLNKDALGVIDEDYPQNRREFIALSQRKHAS